MSSSRSDSNSAQTAVPAKRGRFSTNLAWNLANFVLNIAIGIWLVPYLIKNLGVAAYGLVPLVLQLIPYLQIITLSVNAAVGRYLTIAIEKGDYDRANKIFNTALFAMACLGIALLFLGIAFVHYSPWLLRVPVGMETQAKALCVLAVAGFILTELSLPFGVSMFARNRFDVQNIVNVIATMMRVITVVSLFSIYVPSVWHVGASLFIANLVTAIGAVWAWRKLTPMLRVWRGHYDRTLLKELTTIGGWVVINQVGMLLFISIDLIVVNRMFGTDAGGKYAAVLTWSTLLRGLAGTMASVFGPTVVMYYARNQIDEMVTYVRRAVKFMGLAMALPIGLICGFSESILTIWLGPEFKNLAGLMSLMTLHLCINLAVLPLFNIQQATNKVKWPGIVMIITGVLNVALAVILAGPVGWGLYGVAAAGAIVLTLKNAIFTPIYNALILKKPLHTFFGEITLTISVSILLAGFAFGMVHLFGNPGFLSLAIVSLLISGVYAAVCYLLLLTNEDRARLRTMVRRSRA